MKIIKATDYGFRKVIVIAVNDSEPECIHPGGKHVCAVEIPEGKQCWEVCKVCQYNWRLVETVFDGDQYKTVGDVLVKLTDAELAEIAFARAAVPVAKPLNIVGLVK